MAKPDKVKAPQPPRVTVPFKPVPVISIDQIPGYAEAVAKERKNRLLAFFEVSQTVCGFEVMPLTLRRYMTLQLCGSPFLSVSAPTPEDLCQFLWVTHPAFFKRRNWLAKQMFFLKCRKTFAPRKRRLFQSRLKWVTREERKKRNFQKIVTTIYDLLAQVFQDASRGGGSSKSYYHGVSSVIMTIAGRSGWDEDKILDKPIARLFPYVRICQEQDRMDFAVQTRTPYRNPLSNPSDEIAAKFCIEEGKKSLNRN